MSEKYDKNGAINFARELPSIDDIETVLEDVFGEDINAKKTIAPPPYYEKVVEGSKHEQRDVVSSKMETVQPPAMANQSEIILCKLESEKDKRARQEEHAKCARSTIKMI